VIVGFCGETEAEFQHTLDLLDEIRFDVVHVAAYSPRPGTLPISGRTMLPLAVKKARLQRVEQVQERIARELNVPYQGRVEEVLVERIRSPTVTINGAGAPAPTSLSFPATRPGAEGAAPLPAQQSTRAARGMLSPSLSLLC